MPILKCINLGVWIQKRQKKHIWHISGWGWKKPIFFSIYFTFPLRTTFSVAQKWGCEFGVVRTGNGKTRSRVGTPPGLLVINGDSCWLIAGWWFRSFFIFPLGIIIPTDELIFFRGVETTNQIVMIMVMNYESQPKARLKLSHANEVRLGGPGSGSRACPKSSFHRWWWRYALWTFLRVMYHDANGWRWGMDSTFCPHLDACFVRV